MVVPARADAVAGARRQLAGLLRSSGLAECADTVVLVAQELMVNAMVHGCASRPEGRFVLSAIHGRGCLRVEVEDPSIEGPRPVSRLRMRRLAGDCTCLMPWSHAGERTSPCWARTARRCGSSWISLLRRLRRESGPLPHRPPLCLHPHPVCCLRRPGDPGHGPDGWLPHS
ncbi:ATP-binding protein [Streptomyces zhihengii]